ncbi:MAG: hypothetical protein KDN19_18005 [Verrucomicrobiae bacterium]|nr:hypothetical protein [Verrucomicrobiae bacterium]
MAASHSISKRFLDATLRCATPEGIILLKLFALPSLYRQGQVDRADLYETDILQLLRIDPVTDEKLLTQLESHVSETDLKALAEVLCDLRKRMGNSDRFRESGRSAQS